MSETFNTDTTLFHDFIKCLINHSKKFRIQWHCRRTQLRISENYCLSNVMSFLRAKQMYCYKYNTFFIDHVTKSSNCSHAPSKQVNGEIWKLQKEKNRNHDNYFSFQITLVFDTETISVLLIRFYTLDFMGLIYFLFVKFLNLVVIYRRLSIGNYNVGR